MMVACSTVSPIPITRKPNAIWYRWKVRPGREALARLAAGVDLGDFVTRPLAWLVAEPDGCGCATHRCDFATVPTSWLEIELVEAQEPAGAAHDAWSALPTLRLVRIAIGAWRLDGLTPGDSRAASNPWRRSTTTRRADVKPVERPTSPHFSRRPPGPRPNKGFSR